MSDAIDDVSLQSDNGFLGQGRRLSDRIADHLRSQIASGKFNPGDHLNEVHLTKSLGVSRSPVREAILQLERDGFVDIAPHRGAFVRRVDASVLREIGLVRALLEGAVVRELTQRQSTESFDSSAFDDDIQQMRVAVAEDDREALATAHLAFHSRLSDLSNNSVLRRMLVDLRAQTSVFIRFGHAQFMRGELGELVARHQQLLQVIEDGDIERAEQEYGSHIILLKRDEATPDVDPASTPGDPSEDAGDV